MTDLSKFQQMSGCGACKNAAQEDPDGKTAASYGASFWCKEFSKPVQVKDGATCEKWEYEG